MSIRRRGLLLLGLALLAGASLRAVDATGQLEMVTGANADITVTAAGNQLPRSGFLPLRVRIANRSERERAWEATFVARANGPQGDYAALNSPETFTVPAASTQEFFLYVPVFVADYPGQGMLQIQFSGPEVRRPDLQLNFEMGWARTFQAVEVDPVLEKSLREAFLTDTREWHGRHRGYGSEVDGVGVVDPARWPADWRLWSQFSTLLLAQATWEQLDTARRQALLDWVTLGGRLIKYGSVEPEESWGAGTIETRPDVLGAGMIADTQKPPLDPAALATDEFWLWQASDWQLTGARTWLALYVVAFGLLVGPVNLFFLAPAGRRHRLFVTVPLISCVASVLLFVIITISDGFGGAGTRRALVVLQPVRNQAAIFQRQISRTGLLGGRSFALPAETLIELQPDEQGRTREELTLWRDHGQASGGWFTSRATQRHNLRALVPTRERIELVSAPGAVPVIQSTVAVTLRDFTYRDTAGDWWVAAEVPPGQRVTLQAVRGTMASQGRRIDSYIRLSDRVSDRDTFFALGDSPGGLIPTLPAIRWRDDRVLYAGHLAREVSP